MLLAKRISSSDASGESDDDASSLRLCQPASPPAPSKEFAFTSDTSGQLLQQSQNSSRARFISTNSCGDVILGLQTPLLPSIVGSPIQGQASASISTPVNTVTTAGTLFFQQTPLNSTVRSAVNSATSFRSSLMAPATEQNSLGQFIDNKPTANH